MKFLNLTLILLFALSLTAAATDPALILDNPVSIHQIKLEKGKRGTYKTTGYVVNSYTCPPCPPRAECKPCMMGTNIVISEDNKTLNSYQLTERELILFTKDASVFGKGKKYSFSIKVTDRKTIGEMLNDIELVDYKALE